MLKKLFFVLLILPSAAFAATAPRLIPNRDVDITYSMNPSVLHQGGAPVGLALRQRLRYSAALHMLRVDPPTPGMHVTIDYLTGRMSMIRDAQRSVLEMAAPPGVKSGPGGLPALAGVAGTVWSQAGHATVAGLACTDWQGKAANGTPITLCQTGDGVMLRLDVSGKEVLQATKVVFAPQPAALFTPPHGYTVMTLDQPHK